MRLERHARAAVALAVLLILGAAVSVRYATPGPGDFPGWHDANLRASIELGAFDDTTSGFLTGYNYELLQRFARDHGARIDIRPELREGSFVDTLKLGQMHLVALPWGDSIPDGVLCSRPVDSISVWILPHHDRRRLEELNAWIDDWHKRDEYPKLRARFLRGYHPLKAAAAGRRYGFISPYDSLVRTHAASIGWDWHLLSAVIYQESRFHIDVRSRRGAAGLMQMMPATARRMGAENLFDPEESIRAGVRYLSLLQRHFQDVAEDEEQLRLLTLAAYNAGEGRIDSCLDFAREKGLSGRRWEDIVAVIPEMNELGLFKGQETIAYIELVTALDEAYRAVCP